MHARDASPGSRPVILVAPDSFKGSLSATAVAAAMASGILKARPDARVVACPMADGGEGTLEALAAVTKHVRRVAVRNAVGHVIEVPVARLADDTGLIEVATIIGLTDERNTAVSVLRRSSWGVGDAVRHLLDDGVRRIAIALGGSCTNDGGAGFLCALGLKLFDADGKPVEPTPNGLQRLAQVDASALDARLFDCDLSGLADVDNPLAGVEGATFVFGRQKGVPVEAMTHVDETLQRFAQQLETALGQAASALPGSGAAGGMGFAIQVLNGHIVSGAEHVAASLEMDRLLRDADWVLTGEGRSDLQTLRGKAPDIVSRHARALSIPVTLLSGSIDPDAIDALGASFEGCFSAAPGLVSLEQAIELAADYLANAAEQLTRLFSAGAA